MQPRRSWERQPGESSPAWEARKVYLYMGPTRSIARVGQECSKSGSLLSRWSILWKWVLSAEEFDAYNDEIARIGASERLLEEAHAQAALWEARDSEGPSMAYTVSVDAYNDIVQYIKDVKEGRRKGSVKEKAILIRTYSLMVPHERAARDEMRKRIAAMGATFAADGAQAPGHVPGRALDTVVYFNEYAARNPPEGPEPNP